MIIFKSINNLNKKIKNSNNLGFVPTMGSLHKGHLELIKKSRRTCSKTLVSIFINPKQFNSLKDLRSYPKDLENDLKLLKKNRVDFVLIPKSNDVYNNKKISKYVLKKKDKILCAKFRPGHFEGVLSVINQFLSKININKLFLGNKDFQQLYLIKKYLGKKFKIRIIGCKTIRHNNKYVYSSRNKLLNSDDLEVLSIISKICIKFYYSIKKNTNNKIKLNYIRKKIEKIGAKIEYLELRNKTNLQKKFDKENVKLFIAFYYKKIRFIDNI